MTNQPNQPHTSDSTPSSEELRDRIEHTRDELGQTVEALAAKADVKARAKEKAADAKAQVMDVAADAKAQAMDVAADVKAQAQDLTAQAMEKASVMTEQTANFVKDKTPDPVLDEADRVATRAWANRTPLIAIGAALIVILLVRRGRGRK
ncbi:DUF3618 domain-containing protein [Streptomyces sp. NPDC058289]|uniref:DUF3618 domain-containing protein n=1 Tax=Streptomyces sp. NPDC058289 TaxID=3346425 RepID=UPI0036E39DCE